MKISNGGAIRNNIQSEERRNVGNNGELQACIILKSYSFNNITRSTSMSTSYDFTAEKDGFKCFIEVKTRSAKANTQFFTYRDTQLKHLSELLNKGKVYLLLINKYGHKLVTLDDVLNKKVEDVYIFKYKGRLALMQIRKKRVEEKITDINYQFMVEYVTLSIKLPKQLKVEFKTIAIQENVNFAILLEKMIGLYKAEIAKKFVKHSFA